MTNPRDPLPAYVASDAHLGAVPESSAEAFRSWLAWAGERASTLVINGDLFDFWFEYGTVIPRGHTRTLALLARIVDAGVPVHLFGGNHDWWGGTFLTDEIGVHFHPDPTVLELAGHRCLVAHGDGLGRGDLGYRILRRVLRARFTRWAFRWLHPDVGTAIARRVSRTEIRADGDPDALKGRARELEFWARERLLDDESLDAVLIGHLHLPVRVDLGPGRSYFNTGDWIHHHSYLVLPQGEDPYLARWERGREIPLDLGRTSGPAGHGQDLETEEDRPLRASGAEALKAEGRR